MGQPLLHACLQGVIVFIPHLAPGIRSAGVLRHPREHVLDVDGGCCAGGGGSQRLCGIGYGQGESRCRLRRIDVRLGGFIC